MRQLCRASALDLQLEGLQQQCVTLEVTHLPVR